MNVCICRDTKMTATIAGHWTGPGGWVTQMASTLKAHGEKLSRQVEWRRKWMLDTAMILSMISSMTGIGSRLKIWVCNSFFFVCSKAHAYSTSCLSLSQLYTKAKQMAVERQDHFHGMCILRGCTLVEKWQKEPTQAYQKGSEWHSVYQLKEGKGQS